MDRAILWKRDKVFGWRMSEVDKMMEEEKIECKKDKEKTPYKVTGTWAYKIWTSIGVIFFSLLTLGVLYVVVEMINAGMFNMNSSLAQSAEYVINDAAWSESMRIIDSLVVDESKSDSFVDYSLNNTNISYVYVGSRSSILHNYSDLYSYGEKAEFTPYTFYFETSRYNGYKSIDYCCYLELNSSFTVHDEFYYRYMVAYYIFQIRYWIFAIIALLGGATIALYVNLIKSVGHRKGYTEAIPSFDAKLYFDILTVIFVLAEALILDQLDQGYINMWEVGLAIVSILVCLLLWTISLTSRIKSHILWKNTFIGFLIRMTKKLIRIIPVLWKAALIGLGITAANILGIFLLVEGGGLEEVIGLLIGIPFQLLCFAGIIYMALMYRRLYMGAKELAAGNTAVEINERFMLPTFKTHADYLKSVADGVGLAVEKRMSSERMQAQLITNVSHDIKTPLTSVINYSELISREKVDNEKVKEYSEVLGRQATRLKRLLEDLVEASKASTGNLEVECVPCKASLLVEQAAGEYEEKLAQAGLELIVKNEESEAMIMADPRRMWRVFDNLLLNICKYALPNTRVYLSIEETEKECNIIFKNTSANELDVGPQELMQRFVRGDESRATEGNGLGLSIAGSLAKLQGGDMEIVIDGDLFKVILRFPKK